MTKTLILQAIFFSLIGQLLLGCGSEDSPAGGAIQSGGTGGVSGTTASVSSGSGAASGAGTGVGSSAGSGAGSSAGQPALAPGAPAAGVGSRPQAGTGNSSGGTIAIDAGANPPVATSDAGDDTGLPLDAAATDAEADSDSEVSQPAAAVKPSAACGGSAARPTSGRVSVNVSSSQRAFILHVPSEVQSEPIPLMVSIHGYTFTAAQHEQITRMSQLADREGFAVAYPEGLGDPTSWNAGACCAFGDETRDDVGLMGKIIDQVGASLCIDLNRVYFSGFSNGGMLTYRLACEMSERIAAVASVGGSAVIPLAGCRPKHPMPLMHTHGTADPIVPYTGGPGPDWLTPDGYPLPIFPAASEEVAIFGTLNGCTGSPESTFKMGDAACEKRSGCKDNADVVLCTVTGGGHTWPGGGSMGLAGVVLGSQSQSLPTSQMMWDFLKVHRLR